MRACCGRCGERLHPTDGTPLGETYPIRTPGGAEFRICRTCVLSFDRWLAQWLRDDGREVPDGSDPWRSVQAPLEPVSR
jgi:hypothetical protein